MLYLCQYDDGSGAGAALDINHVEQPSWVEAFKWDMVTAKGDPNPAEWAFTSSGWGDWTYIIPENFTTNREFVLRAWYDCDGNGIYTNTEPHRLIDIKVVDVVDLLLSNSVTGAAVTSLDRDGVPSNVTNTLYLAESTNGTASMTIQSQWAPTNVPSEWFHWEILNLDDTPAENWSSQTDACTNGISAVTWTNTGASATRQFKVRTWYDCDRNGQYLGDWAQHFGPGYSEPVRIANVTVIKVELVPDFNHDRVIDETDKSLISTNGPFRFWINDDHEISDAEGEDWPGSSTPDWNGSHANGVRDLIDFFPVYLDVAQAVTVLPKEAYSYIVKQADGALNGVPTTMKADSANEDLKPEAYQTRSGVAQAMVNVQLQQITSSGLTIPDTYLADAETTGEGFVMVFEGRSVTQNPLVLEIRRKSDNQLIVKSEMPLSLSSVTDMYRTVNLRNMQNPGILAGPSNNPDSLSNGKNLVFLHGYQPGTATTWPTAWLAETFKRFYWSGSLAKFHGVSWFSSGPSATAYQPAVTNAFCTAPVLKDYVAGLNGDARTTGSDRELQLCIDIVGVV